MDPETAEEDACKMEHDISDQTFPRHLRPLRGIIWKIWLKAKENRLLCSEQSSF